MSYKAMSDHAVSEKLNTIFNSYWRSCKDVLNDKNFINSCKATLRGRLAYALMDEDRANRLVDHLNAAGAIVLRAALEGIAPNNYDIYEEFTKNIKARMFFEELVVSLTITCLEVKYYYGAEMLQKVFEKYIRPGTNVRDHELLHFIYLIVKDLMEKKYKDLPNICQF